jgi:hypothetical protein
LVLKNLATHRRSNLLSRSRGISMTSTPGSWPSPGLQGLNAGRFKGPPQNARGAGCTARGGGGAADPARGLPAFVAFPNLAKFREQLERLCNEYDQDVRRERQRLARENQKQLSARPQLDDAERTRVIEGFRQLKARLVGKQARAGPDIFLACPSGGGKNFRIGTHWLQEQTQIIASAIGRPTTKAPTIISENSESKFVPRRAFSTNMPISPPLTSN